MTEPLLDVRQLSRRFAAVDALKDVNFSVEAGEVHALIGPNGAGKTTFIHHVSGALQPDSGSVHFAGRDVTRLAMHQRVAAGMARSYQITNVFLGLSALDNVALAVQGRQDAGSSFRFWQAVAREKRLFDEARSFSNRSGWRSGRLETIAGNLAHGEQRALELAMALATKPQLLLLDEPMAGTGPEESARMVELIEHLARHVTILLVEHDMAAVFRLADRISVLVNGRLIATGTPEAVRADAGSPPRLSRRSPVSAAARSQQSGSRLRPQPGAVRPDLAMAEGEAATLLGRNGMGKTTTLRAICGLQAIKAGSIRFAGERIDGWRPDHIGRAGIALVPEGRQCFPNLTVDEHLVAFFANRRAVKEAVDAGPRLRPLPAPAGAPKNLGNQLSGGEQQMLAIGRALVTNPRLLILDEATEGLAPLVREEIWACLARCAPPGRASW
jgi:branched-chain amino acid transport system ATP-binding protein